MTRRGFTIHWNGPAAHVVGHRTGHARCDAFFRAVAHWQSTHPAGPKWSSAKDRTAYSFGVCPHGVRFTGQGWDRRQFANGAPDKDQSLGADKDWFTVVAFIGEGERPTAEMVTAIRDLIAEGRDGGRCRLEVRPHSDFKYKTCPGPDLLPLCRQWDQTPFEEDDMAVTNVIGKDRSGRWWWFKSTASTGVEIDQDTADFWYMVDKTMYTGDQVLIEHLKAASALVSLAGQVIRA